jgi:putative transposase
MMKRKRYAEEQIISILKEVNAGASVPDVSRRHGIAENTIYRWKSKFGGMEVSEAKRLRELEGENAKRKRLLAEAELERQRCRSACGEKGDGRTAAAGRGAPDEAPHQQRVESLGGSVSAVGPQRRGAAHPPQGFSGSLSAVRLPDAARDAEDRRPRD